MEDNSQLEKILEMFKNYDRKRIEESQKREQEESDL